MQRMIECPVCFNIYDTKVRVPKSLSCGHSSCAPCLCNISSDSSINCPTCRSHTSLPDGEMNQLPTNYAKIECLQSACEECKDQVWTGRCEHCSQNLCDKCRSSHPTSSTASQTNLKDQLKSLKKYVVKMQEKCHDDTVLNQIQSQGKTVITEMNHSYETQIEQMRAQHEEQLKKVKTQLRQDTEDYLNWKDNFSKHLLEMRTFIDRSLAELSLIEATDIEQQQTQSVCDKKLTEVEDLNRKEPIMSKMCFNVSDVDFQSFLAKCGEVNISKDLPTPGIKPVPVPNSPSMENKLVPDYKNSTHKLMCGGKGKGNREFGLPWGIATSKTSDMIAITDTSNNRIQILSKQLDFVTTFGQQGNGNADFNQPQDVAISSDDRMFITDYYNHCIKVTDKQGRFLYKFGSKGEKIGQFKYPRGIALDRDLCYVCDRLNYRVQVTKTDGEFVQSFGSKGSGPGMLEHAPWFICVSHNGKVVISDSGGNLYMFTTRGEHIRTIKANQPPQNIVATGIVIDELDNIIIADTAKCLVVMNQEGGVVCSITHPELGRPRGMALTPDGDIVVCDEDNNKVHLFTVSKI